MHRSTAPVPVTVVVTGVVDVHLGEGESGELLRELLENGANDLARTTPFSPEVNDNDLVTVDLKHANAQKYVIPEKHMRK